MFTATFPNSGEVLRKLIEILKENIKEAVLIAKPDGISIQCMDDSHVALVDVFLDADAADGYVCNEEHQLGINFEALSKVFKSTSAQGVCRLRYDEKHADLLSITFQSDKKKYSVKFKLVDIENDERYGLPDNMNYSCDEMIISNDFKSIIKDLSLFSEDVIISRYNKKLTFSAVGDLADSCIEMSVEDTHNGNISGTYSVKYLTWFSKGSTLCQESRLAFDTSYPLMLHYNALEHGVSLKFFVAPKYNESEKSVSNRLEEDLAEEEDDELDF